MAQNQWEITIRSAKSLETRLEVYLILAQNSEFKHQLFTLQASIQKYSTISQKINADYLCDEENALLESKEEQEMSSIIENDLKKVCLSYFLCVVIDNINIIVWIELHIQLSEAIDILRSLRTSTPNRASQNQDALIKRFYEIHQEFRNEYRNSYVSPLHYDSFYTILHYIHVTHNYRYHRIRLNKSVIVRSL